MAQKEGGPGVNRGLPTEGAVPGLHPNRVRKSLLHHFAVEGEVETFTLNVLAHA